MMLHEGSFSKNFWVQRHNQRNKSPFWTAEFSNGSKTKYYLNPRRVLVWFQRTGPSRGSCDVEFKGAMYNTSDHELLDFFTEARNSMAAMLSVLRYYEGIGNELEYYKLDFLKFQSLVVGSTSGDIMFTFEYNSLHRVTVI